jgi:DHA1 family bicyclomycin/chloramphenicol resistance-like MFS transporter
MNRIGFVLTLGAIAAISATAIDICIPALPEIGRTLGSSPQQGAALVTGYLLGYGPGQLLWGPLSDRFGRMGLLYLAIFGFIAASIGCALAETLDFLVIMRAVQGITGGGAPAIARAIARDQGGGPETAALLSSMAVIIGGAPLLAPLVGSGMLTFADWRWIFGFLALFGVLLVAGVAMFLGRRRRRDKREWVSVRSYVRSAGGLFRAPEFLLGIGISSAVFGGYATILGASAVIAEERFDISPEAFGPIFSIAALTFMAGATTARKMLRRLPLRRFLLAGAAAAACAGIGFAVACGADLAIGPFWAIVCIYTFAFGLLMPTATGMALEPAGAVAGLASSIIGTVQTLMGALSSQLVVAGVLGDSYASLCLIIAGAAAIVVVLALASQRIGASPSDR